MKKTCKNCKYGDPNKREKWYFITWCRKLCTRVRGNKNRDCCMHYRR